MCLKISKRTNYVCWIVIHTNRQHVGDLFSLIMNNQESDVLTRMTFNKEVILNYFSCVPCYSCLPLSRRSSQSGSSASRCLSSRMESIVLLHRYDGFSVVGRAGKRKR